MKTFLGTHSFNEQLKELGLKATPQRIAVMEALVELHGHPTAERIIDYIKQRYPQIAVGTVYNTLELFFRNGLINRVKTEKDIMRYDPVIKGHHHLYSSEDDRIEDYLDEEVSEILEDYFRRKNITDFRIEDVRLQITGKFY
jgi:Fur family peroxide stress response transcriptional regulator